MEGLLHCPLTHKSASSLEKKCEAAADGALSVGGFRSLSVTRPLVEDAKTNQVTCMCALRPGAYWLSRRENSEVEG